MINIPEFEKAFEYENNFYLSCSINRISKILAHYELYKMIRHVPGAIVECGVFKGASFIRFAAFRNLFGSPFSKKIIGFDTFAEFPKTNYSDDIKLRNKFIDAAGSRSIAKQQLLEVLKYKNTDQFIELIAGNINETVPKYVEEHPEFRISLLNLDTDIYEPTRTILKYLYPRIVNQGVLVLDDYGVFPGETSAVEEYFKENKVEIKKFPFCMTPCYVKKNN